MRDGSNWHALAAAIFAFEELAKYSELRSAKKSATSAEVEVDERLFKDHKYKQDKARQLLPSEAVDLFPAGFDRQLYDQSWFDMQTTTVTPSLRLDAVFVNWKEGHWIHGTPFLPERLKSFVDEILNCLHRLETGPD
jgi:AbiV family abortive infection protein